MKTFFQNILIVALLFAAPSSAAHAVFVEVHSDTAYTGGGGPGTGRGQGFQALSGFSITSVGIEANLVAQSFDVDIYSSTTGSDVGGLLATATTILGGGGFGFYDLAISFTFDANDFYVVNWKPSSSNSSWVNSSGGGPGNPGVQYYLDSDLPVTDSSFLLIEGFEGFLAQNSGNFLHPSLRYDVGLNPVPLPAALPLFGTGLGIMGLLGWRRKRRAVAGATA